MRSPEEQARLPHRRGSATRGCERERRGPAAFVERAEKLAWRLGGSGLGRHDVDVSGADWRPPSAGFAARLKIVKAKHGLAMDDVEQSWQCEGAIFDWLAAEASGSNPPLPNWSCNGKNPSAERPGGERCPVFWQTLAPLGPRHPVRRHFQQREHRHGIPVIFARPLFRPPFR